MIAIVAFAWKLTGVTMFLLQLDPDPARLAGRPPERQAVCVGMTLPITGIAALLLWHARRASVRGWLRWASAARRRHTGRARA